MSKFNIGDKVKLVTTDWRNGAEGLVVTLPGSVQPGKVYITDVQPKFIGMAAFEFKSDDYLELVTATKVLLASTAPTITVAEHNVVLGELRQKRAKYVTQVRDAIINYAESNDWDRDEVNGLLDDLGLESWSETYQGWVELRVYVTIEGCSNEDEATDAAGEITVEAGYTYGDTSMDITDYEVTDLSLSKVND